MSRLTLIKNRWKQTTVIILASIAMLVLSYWDMIFYMATSESSPFFYAAGGLTILLPASICLFMFCIIGIIMTVWQNWLGITTGFLLAPCIIGVLGALPGILALMNLVPHTSQFFFFVSLIFMIVAALYILLALIFYLRATLS